MIAGWLAYCLVVSTLVAVAAAAVDELLTATRRAARAVWFIGIVASLAIPAATLLLQQRTPAPIPDAADARFGDIFSRVRMRERAEEANRNANLLDRVPRVRTPQWLAADRLATAVIVLCIVFATVRVAVDSTALFRGRRRWRAHVVDDAPVLVSADLGPAIVGLITPAIVIPAWAASLPAHACALMLAHEREHLRARDGLLSAFGLLGALCMPWSPAIWWMFRRLRIAIEVDCDRRVLRAFPDVRAYGRLLVDVASRPVGGSPLTITGFSQQAGSLARRIHAMTTGQRDAAVSPLRHVVRGATSLTAVVAALMVLPPLAPPHVSRPAPPPPPQPKSVADSIGDDAESDRSALRPTDARRRIVSVAKDLPAAFVVDEPGAARDAVPLAGRCALALHDPRNGVRLRLKRSSSTTGVVAQRGDTAWTRVAQVGLYRVSVPGAYGVSSTQLLRVGCGASTKITIAHQAPPSPAQSTLESRTDERAQRVAVAIDSAIHHAPKEVELYPQRLNVVIDDDFGWFATTPNEKWALTRRTWAAVRDVVGLAAMPETLAFSVRFDSGGSATFFYYTSMARKE